MSDVKIIGCTLDGKSIEIASVDDIDRVCKETGHDGVLSVEIDEKNNTARVFFGKLPKTESQ